VDIIVNASNPSTAFLNLPTAVQLPADAHDTALKYAFGVKLCTPLANTAGAA
jgi:hypothetical protein